MINISQDSLQGCLKHVQYWCDKGVLWERYWLTSRRMSQHIWYATCAMKIHEDCWQWCPIMKKQEQKVWKRSLIPWPCLHFSTPPNNPGDTVGMRHHFHPFPALPPSFNVTFRTAIQGKHIQLTKHCTPLVYNIFCCTHAFYICCVHLHIKLCVVLLYTYNIYISVCIYSIAVWGSILPTYPSPDPAASVDVKQRLEIDIRADGYCSWTMMWMDGWGHGLLRYVKATWDVERLPFTCFLHGWKCVRAKFIASSPPPRWS